MAGKARFDASAVSARPAGTGPSAVEVSRGAPPEPGKAGRMNLLQLPRRDPYLHIDVERAFREAGCHICRGVIAKGDIRLAIDVALMDVREDRIGRERTEERYYVHASCVIAALEGEDPRPFNSCWDCGSPLSPTEPTFSVFTTHRFAYSRLCNTCSAKPRWAACWNCNVHFPHWMVSFTRDEERLCDWCSERTGNDTRRVVDARKREFDQLRQDILREGI